jgi:hypothetical protein
MRVSDCHANVGSTPTGTAVTANVGSAAGDLISAAALAAHRMISVGERIRLARSGTCDNEQRLPALGADAMFRRPPFGQGSSYRDNRQRPFESSEEPQLQNHPRVLDANACRNALRYGNRSICGIIFLRSWIPTFDEQRLAKPLSVEAVGPDWAAWGTRKHQPQWPSGSVSFKVRRCRPSFQRAIQPCQILHRQVEGNRLGRLGSSSEA